MISELCTYREDYVQRPVAAKEEPTPPLEERKGVGYLHEQYYYLAGITCPVMEVTGSEVVSTAVCRVDASHGHSALLIDDTQGIEGVPMTVLTKILSVRESHGANFPGSRKELKPLFAIKTVCMICSIEHHACDSDGLLGGSCWLPTKRFDRDFACVKPVPDFAIGWGRRDRAILMKTP